MRAVSERVADSLVSNHVLTEEDKPLYVYGLHLAGMSALNLATAVVIGLLSHMVWQSLVFLALYIPLRRVAGGYHASTEFRCYVASTAILCMALSVMHRIVMSTTVLYVLLLLSGTLIFLLAPVQSANKPLDAAERVVYRKRSRRILLVHGCIVVISLWIPRLIHLVLVIAMADTTLALLLILGRVDGRRMTGG